MKPRNMTLVALAPLIVASVCLTGVFLARALIAREQQVTRADPQPAPIIGVIMAGAAQDYGWDDPGAPYAETSLDGYPVILLDQFTTARRDSGLTLSTAITEMVQRGASAIFVSPGCTLTAGDAVLNDAGFSGTVIFNQADRTNITILLPALEQALAAPSVEPPTEEEDSHLPLVGLLAVLITTGLMLRAIKDKAQNAWRNWMECNRRARP